MKLHKRNTDLLSSKKLISFAISRSLRTLHRFQAKIVRFWDGPLPITLAPWKSLSVVSVNQAKPLWLPLASYPTGTKHVPVARTFVIHRRYGCHMFFSYSRRSESRLTLAIVSSSGGIVSHDNPKPPRCILTISGGRRAQGIKEGLKSSTDTASRTRALSRFLQPKSARQRTQIPWGPSA